MSPSILIPTAFVALLIALFGTVTNDQTIAITKGGFSPDFISIPKGTTVTWVNQVDELHWPASNAHPSHKQYPGSDIEKCLTSERNKILDACRGLKKGESFTFVFNEVGKWGMHDHLYPGLVMAIEVIEEQNTGFGNLLSGLNSSSEFSKKNEPVQFPSSEYFLNLTYLEQQNLLKELSKNNSEESWMYLKKTFGNNGIRQNPHEFAHIVGGEIYRQLGFKGIGICDPAFAFGCYHGVTEKMLVDLGVNAIDKIESSCLDIFPNQPQPAASCIHGIGHGLITWRGLDIEEALNDCDLLSNQYRIYCYDGVFMEYSFSAPNLGDVANKWEFCASFDEKYHPLCAKYQTSLLFKSGLDFSQSAKICEEAPNKILKEHCLFGLGYSAANTAKGNGNEIERLCSLVSSEEGRYTCVIYAAKEVIFQEYANWWEVYKNLCQGLSEDWASECLNKARETIEGYSKQIPSSEIQPMEIQKIKATDNLNKQTKLYKALIERVGAEQAQEYLYRSGLPFTGQTHLLNHEVGDYLYEKYGNAGLVKCKDYFLSSCYHGFILHAIPDGLVRIDAIVNECKKFGATVVSQCSHAIGHGFLTWVGYQNLTGALDLCDTMTKRVDNFPSFNCRDGVFMENVWGVHEGKPSPDRWVKADDEFYPCNDPRINPDYLDGCWSNQPSLMYQMFKGDIKRVGEECLKVENPEHRRICFNGLSRQIHPLTKSNVDKTFQLCSLLPTGWVNYCSTTVALSDFSVGGRDSAFKICNKIDGSGKENCYSSLFGTMSVYARTSDEYREFCGMISEERWQEECRAFNLR